MREVKVNVKHDGISWEDGYFHGFFQEGNLEDGVFCMACIELTDGIVKMVNPEYMKFIKEDNIF